MNRPNRCKLVRVRASLVSFGIFAALTSPCVAWASPATVCPGFDSSALSRSVQRIEAQSDTRAEALMAAIESDFRRGSRVVRMVIRTHYGRHRMLGPQYALEPSEKILWGVIHAGAERTDLLYVFSGPGRLAGTTLLMHDHLGARQPDASWLFLRSLGIFKKLGAETGRALIPGTALSYEDSRGFVSSDKYRFFLSTEEAARPLSADATGISILACPRDASIADQLGYSALRLRADPDLRIVRFVEYLDLAGQPLKIYTLLRHAEFDGRSVPTTVRLEHFSEGFVTTIDYEHWLPERPPPASLFDPDIEKGEFVARLQTFLSDTELGDRIESELAVADAKVREYTERLRKMDGGEAAVRGISAELGR